MSVVNQEVTVYLEKWRTGDQSALYKVWPVVYPILKERAGFSFRQSGASEDYNTLSHSALVNDAFVKLLGKDFLRTWAGRNQFFRMCQVMMTRMLIDQKRKKGKVQTESLDQDPEVFVPETKELEVKFQAMEQGLEKLKAIDSDLYYIVDSLFLSSPTKTIKKLAAEMKVSESTIYRDKKMAFAELQTLIEESSE